MTVNLGTLNWLIVDDDPLALEGFCLLLEDLGASEIRSYTSPRDALSLLSQGAYAPDITVVDLQMPQVDGLEFMRSLAAQKYRGGVIILSGVSEMRLSAAEELSRAHRLNTLGALGKPFDVDALLTLIRKFDRIVASDVADAGAAGIDLSRDELRNAIKGKAFSPVYQPIVTLADGQVSRVEALARWRHSRFGEVAPSRFIPLIEQCDLMQDFTLAFLDTTCRDCSGWRQGGRDLRVSVNLSVACLTDLGLPERIRDLVSGHGLAPSQIMFEVTESQVLHDLPRELEILNRLCLMGFDLALDDFGTGHASLEQLKRLPFSELKIDRVFVHGASDSPVARGILEAGVDLARRLDISVVAEGIERGEDWDLVKSLKCDFSQGHFLAQPMRAPALLQWMGEQHTFQ